VLLTRTLRSSTLRLALLYIALFAAAILGLFGYVYGATLSYLHRQALQQVAHERALLAAAYRRGGRARLVGGIQERLAVRDEGWRYLLIDGSGRPLVGNLTQWPGAADTSDRATLRLLGGTMVAAFETLPDGSRLLVSRDENGDAFARTMALGLGAAVFGIIVLAAAAGISTARRSVSRIETINATSRAIMRAGLGSRIRRRGTGDEWDELADNLNAMLDRIEELVETNRQVTDNIAHDLRTPLTRLRGRIERATAEPLDIAACQGLLGDTIAELDEILRTFASLLRISRIEAYDRSDGFRELDLAALAREVIEMYEPAAEEVDAVLALSADEPVPVDGDRDLLFDALSNLVDNALKHGSSRGLVTVSVGDVGREPLVVISDRGPGIPHVEHRNVLKRFYRLERSRNSPGNGLGLSLVAAVAHLHGAAIEMSDNRPGLRVALRFSPRPAIRASSPGRSVLADAPRIGE
jgi:signal transduction histidine kinase